MVKSSDIYWCHLHFDAAMLWSFETLPNVSALLGTPALHLKRNNDNHSTIGITTYIIKWLHMKYNGGM